MGPFWVFIFGEKDAVLVQEIAKAHKLSEDIVEKHYKKMLGDIKDELSKKVKD